METSEHVFSTCPATNRNVEFFFNLSCMTLSFCFDFYYAIIIMKSIYLLIYNIRATGLYWPSIWKSRAYEATFFFLQYLNSLWFCFTRDWNSHTLTHYMRSLTSWIIAETFILICWTLASCFLFLCYICSPLCLFSRVQTDFYWYFLEGSRIFGLCYKKCSP